MFTTSRFAGVCLALAVVTACNGPDRGPGNGPAAQASPQPRAATQPSAATLPATQPLAAIQPLPATQPAHSADDLAIFEAVFRHQFRNNVSGQRDVAYFFLTLSTSPDRRTDDYFPISLHEADPPPELLNRFKHEDVKVLGASLARTGLLTHVRHKDTEEDGLIFYIVDVVRLEKDTAEVRGGYYANGRSSSGNTYRVVRSGGRWVVTSESMNWIS